MADRELLIILKRYYPFKQKCAVLGQTIGKAFLAVPEQRDARLLWPGALVAAVVEKRRGSSVYGVNNYELLGVWHELTPEELRLNHQLMEMAYYLVPAGTISTPLFNALYVSLSVAAFLPASDIKVWSWLSKVKLLAECGFAVPQQLIEIVALFDQCAMLFIDVCDRETITSQLKSFSSLADITRAQVEAWVTECTSNHPCFAHFKALGEGYIV